MRGRKYFSRRRRLLDTEGVDLELKGRSHLETDFVSLYERLSRVTEPVDFTIGFVILGIPGHPHAQATLLFAVGLSRPGDH